MTINKKARFAPSSSRAAASRTLPKGKLSQIKGDSKNMLYFNNANITEC